MKKVLLAFDGQHFSKGVFEFVKQINKHQPVIATGFFLPGVDYIELLYSYGGVPAGPLYISEAVKTDEKILNNNITMFIELCQQNGIACTVHSDFNKHVLTYIKQETRFADLLVVSSKLFYENLGADTQKDYIENTLHKAECPVILVSEDYTMPSSIIMAYDGSEASVFAIKQFTYLFPEFRDHQVLLVYLDRHALEVPDRSYIEELMAAYYTQFTISKLKIDSQQELEQWLMRNDNALLVTGAYGRSLLSELFRKSFITEVLHQHKVPIFVAHK